MNSHQIFQQTSKIVDTALTLRRSLDQTGLTVEAKIQLDHIVSLGLELERMCIDAQNKELEALIQVENAG